MNAVSDPGLAAALSKFSRRKVFAAAIGITTQAIAQWDRVPSKHVIAVERVSGIDRHVLRPDLYPPPRADALGAA